MLIITDGDKIQRNYIIWSIYLQGTLSLYLHKFLSSYIVDLVWFHFISFLFVLFNLVKKESLKKTLHYLMLKSLKRIYSDLEFC